MRDPKRAALLFILAFGITVTTAITTPRTQGQGQEDNRAKERAAVLAKVANEDVSQFPIVELTAPEPNDLQGRETRRARNSRYDKRDNALLLRVQEEGSGVVRDHWFWLMPALPAGQSDAVVLGEVRDAKAYLSNDKTGIYSEFTISIEEVLKDDAVVPLAPNGSIVAEREGGRVRLPSGNVRRFKIAEQNMPRIGRRYVLFLKHYDQTPDFRILTGYELSAGKVHPLDGEFAKLQFAQYDGFSANDFIKAVQETIANPTLVSP